MTSSTMYVIIGYIQQKGKGKRGMKHTQEELKYNIEMLIRVLDNSIDSLKQDVANSVVRNGETYKQQQIVRLEGQKEAYNNVLNWVGEN